MTTTKKRRRRIPASPDAIVHGTRSQGYARGCRCDRCRKANSTYAAAHPAKNRAPKQTLKKRAPSAKATKDLRDFCKNHKKAPAFRFIQAYTTHPHETGRPSVDRVGLCEACYAGLVYTGRMYGFRFGGHRVAGKVRKA